MSTNLDHQGYKLVNFVRVKRVVTDNSNKAFHDKQDSGLDYQHDGFYLKAYSLVDEKNLYVYHIDKHETLPSICFADKFGTEYQLFTQTKAKGK